MISIVVLSTSAVAQNELKTYFAIGLFTGAQSQLVTYAFVTYRGPIFVSAEIIRKDRFMYSAFGYWPSPANKKRENLFEKYEIDSCFLLENEYLKVDGYYCPVFDEFWKIRFFEHPMLFDEPGWSQGQFKPSRFQMEFLHKEYGIKNVLTDYIYGDSLFKLLNDMQTPEWRVEYRFVHGDDSTATYVPPAQFDTTSTTP